MDDFNGSFCNEGPFPVVSAVSKCFKNAMTTTTTTSTSTTTSKKLTTVLDSFESIYDPPKRPVNVIIQGNLIDKNSIFGKYL